MNKNLIFTFYLGCFTGIAIQAQNLNFAGPDKKICPGESVIIGTPGYSTLCYHWEPEQGLDDPTSPMPTATPMETTRYKLTIVNHKLYFSATDEVTVSVTGIENITATPKRCCWKKGEPIKLDDFYIQTTPPDKKVTIKIEPELAPFSFLEAGESMETIKLKYLCGDKEVKSVDVKILVVDEDWKQSVSTLQINLNTVDAISKLCDLTTKMGFLVYALRGAPCQPELKCTCDIPLSSISYNKKCCINNPKCVEDIIKVVGINGGISAGVNCYFPFAGVPGVASVNLNLAANASVTFSSSPIINTCEGGNKSCFKLALAGNVQGGIAGCIGPCSGSSSLIRVQGALIGTISPESDIEYCLPGGYSQDFHPCLQLDLAGGVTFLSGITFPYKVNILKKTCFFH